MALIDIILDSPEVRLEEMLQARESRAERQQTILAEHCCPLVCITLNMPGSHKAHALAEKAFFIAREAMLSQLDRAGLPVRVIRDHFGKAGFEGFYAVDGDAEKVKSIAVTIEESHPIGRIFDIDVIDRNGMTLRGDIAGRAGRQCLICGGPVWDCSRSRKHSVEELSLRAASMIQEYVENCYADHIAAMATRALIYEVGTTPKPGLVDQANSGAHHDMDFFTFIDSSAVLTPYFRDMVLRGMAHAGEIKTILPALRLPGIWAEEKMLAATNGVNTHKGVIFSLGIFCAAIGYLKNAEIPLLEETLFDACSAIARETITELDPTQQEKNSTTHGLDAYARFGITGIRGEAAAGYPHVRQHGLPALRRSVEQGHSINNAGVVALLHLMAHVQDTNIVSRAGPEVLGKIQQEVSRFLQSEDDMAATLEYAKKLDSSFIRENISPGGSADLLALTFFCHFVL